MYNQDCHMCQMCDDEPAVYNGLCATCLLDGDDEEQFGGRRVRPTYRRKDERDEGDY
jgi:hypothetical protein